MVVDILPNKTLCRIEKYIDTKDVEQSSQPP